MPSRGRLLITAAAVLFAPHSCLPSISVGSSQCNDSGRKRFIWHLIHDFPAALEAYKKYTQLFFVTLAQFRNPMPWHETDRGQYMVAY